MAETNIEKPGFFGVRHIQYVLYFFCCLLGYAIRVCFSVAIVAMISSDSPSENIPTYPEWSSQKNVMLSTFFWGYVCTQVIGGQLAKRFGPKWLLAGTFFMASLFSILIPVFGATFGYKGVIACRVIQGLSQGVLFPCIQQLVAVWSPAVGRTKAGGFAYGGAVFGVVVAMPATGLISSSGNLGWPVAYYLFGGCGILWTIFWAIFGADSPSEHKLISESEKRYISGGLDAKNEEESEAEKKVPTPWIAILTSLPFWAIIINDCGSSWAGWLLLSEIPSYMQSILNFDIASNSLLSTLPYFARALFIIPTSILSDYLISRSVTTITTSRKIFNSAAMFGAAVCLLIISLIQTPERAVIIIVILVVADIFTAGCLSGYIINQVDLAPNHAGILMGICNTASNFFSLLAPLSVDVAIYFTGYQETDIELWTIMFGTATGILIVVGFVFVLAGSGEVQPWNDHGYKEKKEEDVVKENVKTEL